jgi:hypothetical protein
MNCKPGDLAIVVRSGKCAGRLFDVLYAAPLVRFKLPDGHFNVAGRPGDWVLKAVGRPVKAKCIGGERVTWYACGADVALRPIRNPGADETDETLAWKPVPVGMPEVV